MEQTLSLLFLMNPSPHSNYFGKFGKNISFQLGPNPVPLCIIFELQSTTLTNQPSHVINKHNLNVRIHSTSSRLRKFSFSFQGGIPLYCEMGMGKGCWFESTRTPLPHFFLFSLLILPTFLLTFSKHRSYLVFRKRFYYLRNTLFSFYKQSVQKNFKTSRCFAMAQHHFLESHFPRERVSLFGFICVAKATHFPLIQLFPLR